MANQEILNKSEESDQAYESSEQSMQKLESEQLSIEELDAKNQEVEYLKRMDKEESSRQMELAQEEIERIYSDSKESTKICPSCGNALKFGVNFCGKCGFDFTKKNESGNEIVEKEKKFFRAFFEDGKHNNEVSVVPNHDKFAARIDAKLKSAEGDSGDFPDDFYVGVGTNADCVFFRDDDDREYPMLQLGGPEFDVNGKKVSFSELCPDGVELFIGGLDGNSFKYSISKKEVEDRRVELSQLMSPSDFVAMLHEIGHVKDTLKRETTDLYHKINVEKDLPDSQKWIQAEQLSSDASEERNAWAEAIKISRKFNLSIEKYIKDIAQKKLATYQERANKFGGVEIGVDDKKRREMRRQGKNAKGEIKEARCPSCGSKIGVGEKFCSECGTNLV
ncbi:MAG: hypothetical protein A2360_03960 [Candidatus Staskawiczbacteria bacterium RIFOXYB1_FULL_32_11]|uniref:Zinc-ribbon domain-containing protein n=1 Tax=Candidatus Staskawiczbacteria bacterium RIFOXYD1_FULL_32_13 TaxID=1802234 RepID=A0A1G2JNV5_9BACT|nr:MAG: hypothetical protein UR22_C0010G0011 [Parcubacteria group bacterium GW2011_GWC2_32_10]OGZ79152.1 MAG: hypothetical protein A2360_03960 [Candidatus Staskawiczbacteria bacterium RIFOXYB1_FULL_32_11]OGZ87837.1 MAG: hypothetical protein A2463_03455 [Candidatus Staskawiczbacteria bacterium RIFOXYC2_FULL_32_10]OGZ88826.1 MAG: hypothetical protein A2561_05045 [Candidatus Staskawiczbacteria bacterium RIFOXYD1_FULL_32_13]